MAEETHDLPRTKAESDVARSCLGVLAPSRLLDRPAGPVAVLGEDHGQEGGHVLGSLRGEAATPIETPAARSEYEHVDDERYHHRGHYPTDAAGPSEERDDARHEASADDTRVT